MFNNYKIHGLSHAVTWTNLKLVMANLGLKISNQTKKSSKEFLALSKLPSFNYEKAFRRAIKEELLINKVNIMKIQDKKYVKDEGELHRNSLNYKRYVESEMKSDASNNFNT